MFANRIVILAIGSGIIRRLSLDKKISIIFVFSKLPYVISFMRHYDTSRKVTGSIPDEVIGFFN
jgi:hypothetical protein